MTSTVKQTATVVCLMLCVAAFFSDSVVAQTLPCESISREDAYNFKSLSLEERTQAADVVVEGQIIKKGATLTTHGTYLSYIKIQVYKVFKGKNVKKTVVILGSEYRKETRNNKDTLVTCYPNLDTFPINEPESKYYVVCDVFFLNFSKEKIDKEISANKNVFVLINAFGYYNYMEKYWLMFARFKGQRDSMKGIKESDLEKEMYQSIENYTHKKYKVLKRKPKSKEANSGNESSKLESEQVDPIITAINPNPISSGKMSGTESTITSTSNKTVSSSLK